MKLKRVEPDSCDNCVQVGIVDVHKEQGLFNELKENTEEYQIDFGIVSRHCYAYCKKSMKILPVRIHTSEMICEDGYEDDGSRVIK